MINQVVVANLSDAHNTLFKVQPNSTTVLACPTTSARAAKEIIRQRKLMVSWLKTKMVFHASVNFLILGILVGFLQIIEHSDDLRTLSTWILLWLCRVFSYMLTIENVFCIQWFSDASDSHNFFVDIDHKMYYFFWLMTYEILC